MRAVTLAAAAACCFVAAPATAEEVTITGAEVVSGFTPRISVEHLKPGERVRVHSLRMFSVWEPDPGKGWKKVPKPLHAWGDFLADDKGRVDLWRTAPLAGTFSGADPYGILWSGRPVAATARDPYLPAAADIDGIADGKGILFVTRKDTILARANVAARDPDNLVTEEVTQGRLNGFYAAPRDGSRHPTLILLHGSEGGDRASAAEIAKRFAGQGFAAFAFNYFAWDLKNIAGVPNAHVNQPIEMLAAVRDWLAVRPEADVRRLGVYGHSKGAEYAEVAAVHLPWIKAVAACVPTDVVWEGYGIGDSRNRTNPFGKPPERYSSFSWKGRPLPYVPLAGDRSGYHNNTAFYDAKRAQAGAGARLAEIPVEKAKASFLWLGGGRDEVWASGVMAQALDKRMRRAGRGDDSELHVYDEAGHGICGEGTYPTRVWNADTSDLRDPDLDATGRATINAWKRITAFFSRTLRAASESKS